MWLVLLSLAPLLAAVTGHGRVLEPPSRASAWRFGYPTRPDYDDDGVNCGGFSHQWTVNRGRCGICGDAYDAARPRAHELGGIYGQGVVVARYQPGDLMAVVIDLTASHRGYWQLKLCPDPEDNDQECFDRHVLELENGDTKYYPTRGSTQYNLTYRLPSDLICEHCVLQWRYTAGNNWGVCANGTQGLGCGNQEQFGACSDIIIGVSKFYDAVQKMKGFEDLASPLFYYLRHGYFDVQKGLLHLIRKNKARGRKRIHAEAKPRKKKKKHRKKSKHRQKKVLHWR